MSLLIDLVALLQARNRKRNLRERSKRPVVQQVRDTCIGSLDGAGSGADSPLRSE